MSDALGGGYRVTYPDCVFSENAESGSLVTNSAGFTDSQAGPTGNSSQPIFLNGGANRYKFWAICGGGGGIAIATGGTPTIGGFGGYASTPGATVVLDEAVPFGFPGGGILYLGETRLMDTPGARCSSQFTVRVYGGAQVVSVLALPNPVDQGGGTIHAASGGGNPAIDAVSGTEILTDFYVPVPFSGPIYGYFFGLNPLWNDSSLGGSTSDFAPIVAYFSDPFEVGEEGDLTEPNGLWEPIMVPLHGNALGVTVGSWGIGHHANFFAVGSDPAHPGIDANHWYQEPISVTVTDVIFHEYSQSCHGGPPMFNTVHRAHQPDEAFDGDGTPNANAPLGGVTSLSGTSFRSSQADEDFNT